MEEEARRRRGRKAREARRYRGALENPLSWLEFGVSLLTMGGGFMTGFIADRFMAVRKGAPVSILLYGGRAPQLAMYHDWPRLLVAGGITAAPIVVAAFVKGPVIRSAFQTFGMGSGLYAVSNILIGVTARMTTPKGAEVTTAKRLFAFEQAVESGFDEYAKLTDAEKKSAQDTANKAEGLGRLGMGASPLCPACGRRDGLGACCTQFRASMAPERREAAPPPPPPPPAPPPPAPPIEMAPPMVPRREAPPAPPPAITAPPTTVFAPFPAAPPATRPPAGIPRTLGRASRTVFRPNWNWGAPGE